MLHTIGQFSAMTKIPAKTLRYYDEIGLLKPAMIDPDNSYRYYDADSLLTAQQLLIFRACGIPLDTIGRMLNEKKEGGDLLSLLQRHTETLEKRLSEIESYRSALDGIISSLQGSEEQQVITAEREAMTVIALRQRGGHETISSLISSLFEESVRCRLEVTGPHSIIWHEEKDFDSEDMDMEIFIPVAETKSGCSILKAFPAQKRLSVIHRGPISTLGSSYEKIYDYAENENLSLEGPFEEQYSAGGRFINPSQMSITLSAAIGGGK